jgi:large subunit ribosomal protein L6
MMIPIADENGILSFEASSEDKQTRSNWGTMRALSANAAQGAVEDFIKELKIEGVGYRATVEGNEVVFNVGYSHPVKFNLPEGVKASVEKNILKISGADKRLVGEVAAEMRAIRKPEPYKGTGIMYVGEVIRRKAGKKVAGSGEGK